MLDTRYEDIQLKEGFLLRRLRDLESVLLTTLSGQVDSHADNDAAHLATLSHHERKYLRSDRTHLAKEPAGSLDPPLNNTIGDKNGNEFIRIR